MKFSTKTPIEVLDRIIKDFDLLNIKKLSESLGLKRPERIYKVYRGKNGISADLGKIITAKYPKYNLSWVLTGEGDPISNIIKEDSIIKSNTGSIEVERFVDVFLEHRDKFEKNERFKEYINGLQKDAIIEYQEKLLRKSQKTS